MKKRVVLLCLALLFPVLLAIGIAVIALPGVLPIAGINSTAITQIVQQKPAVIPQTLEEARQLTAKRLAHLQSITQAQWDVERAAIRYKKPPLTIEDAIARTQLRITDLETMSEADWEIEKERLIERNRELASR